MSASCQSINSMFKVRPIRTCAKFEPVKESEAQIPSVELITELVKVELQELCFYVMVRVQYAPFGIADGNVHPRQNFPRHSFCHPQLRHGGRLSLRPFQERHNC